MCANGNHSFSCVLFNHMLMPLKPLVLLCNRERRIDLDERTRPGSSMLKLWIEILHPTEGDKGKYTLEMFDGVDTHKRSLDLSGQGNEPAYGIRLMAHLKRTRQMTINIIATRGNHISKHSLLCPFSISPFEAFDDAMLEYQRLK